MTRKPEVDEEALDPLDVLSYFEKRDKKEEKT